MSTSDDTAVFAAWLEGEPLDEIAAPSVAEELDVFALICELASRIEADFTQPSGCLALATVLEIDFDMPDETSLPPEAIIGCLSVLDDYARFAFETKGDEDAWAETWDQIEDILGGIAGEPAFADEFVEEMLALTIKRARQIDPRERAAEFASMPIVAGVGKLLDWLGAGRPVTATGDLKRVDIEPVAAMIGLRARGVASPDLDNTDVFETQSMAEVLPLAAWWDSLQSLDLIEVRGRRVRPGSDAARWQASDVPPIELATLLVATFVAAVIGEADAVSQPSIDHLIAALACGIDADVHPPHLDDPRSGPELWSLRDNDLLVADDEGHERVPPAYREAIATALRLVTTFGTLRNAL